jgi:hypothetical protein
MYPCLASGASIWLANPEITKHLIGTRKVSKMGTLPGEERAGTKGVFID